MLYLKAWAYLLSPPNLWDLVIKKEKIITKQKALATSADGNEKVSLPALLAIASTLKTYEKNKMKIIPSDKIEILTTLSNQEVRKILIENIRPKKGLRIGFNKPTEKELFEGSFEQDRFEMQRIINGRNSFLPQIKGQIQPNINGTKLVADLKVHTFVIVFMLFWLTFVGFAFIMGFIGVINQSTNPILLIFPLIMIGFGIGLVNYGFNSQKDKAISDIKRIIYGQIKEKTFDKNVYKT